MVGQPGSLVKTPAGQINLSLTDLPQGTTQKNESHHLSATVPSLTDENRRDFVTDNHAIISDVLIFNNYPADTNAALKTGNENSLKL